MRLFVNAAHNFAAQSKFWTQAWHGLILLHGMAVLFTFHAYGVTSDEHHHVKYGRDVFNWYVSFFQNYTVFESVNTWLYGGFFDVTAYVLSLVLPLDVHDTRHLYCALVGLLGVVAAYRIGCLFGGPRAGFIAALFLVLTPRYYGHAFNNTKDIPFAVFYLWSVYGLLFCLKKLPDVRLKDCALLGLAIGLTMAIRSSGVVLFLYVGLGFGLWCVARRHRLGVFDWRGWLKSVGVLLGVSYGVLFVFWPYLQLHPVMGLWDSVRLFASFNDVHYSYFEGAYVASDALPWYYAPKWLLLTLPEFVLVGLVCGLGWLVVLVKERFHDQMLLWGMLFFAGVFPLVYAVVNGTPLYDGLRQMLFVVPPLVVVSGVGFERFVSWLGPLWIRAVGWSIAVSLLVLGVYDVVGLHPNQYVYFNRVVAGGLAEASMNYETDYWNHSYKQGITWLEQHYDAFARDGGRVRVGSLYPNVEVMLDADRFEVVEPEEADVYLGTTRYDHHRAMPGELLHKVEVDGVPLLYVVRPDSSYRGDPFFDESAMMHNRLGDAYRAQGDLRAAYDAYEHALEKMADGFTFAGFDRAGVLLKMGNVQLGLDDYDVARGLFGRINDQKFIGSIANNVGFYLITKKQHEEAVVWLQKAIDAAPDFYQPRVSLATSYWDLGDTVQAVAGYKEAARRFPIHAERQFKLGNLLYGLGAFDEARVCFERLVHYHSYDVRGPYYLGLTLAAKGDQADAQKAFEAALSVDPEHLGVLQSLGTMCMHSKDFSGAVRYLQKATALAPDQADLYVMLGLALLNAKDMAGAAEAFDHALQIDPTEATAREYSRFLKSMIDE